MQYILFVVKINIIYLKSKSPFTEFMRNITEYVMKLWHVMKHSFAPNPDLEICPPLRRSQNCRWGRQTQPGKSVAINKEQRAYSVPCLFFVFNIFITVTLCWHWFRDTATKIKLKFNHEVSLCIDVTLLIDDAGHKTQQIDEAWS